MLTLGSNDPLVINAANAYFFLNFLWALGLTNKNPILTQRAMVQQARNGIGGYASTGEWTLGTKQATELYASESLIALTPEQQARLEDVTSHVFRPCCGNATDFPDCNHGMAMLALLELMASQNASTKDMFSAAKYVNAFWFPQQAAEVAMFFKASQNLDIDLIDPGLIVSSDFFSLRGFISVHEWLPVHTVSTHGPANQTPS